MNRKFRPLKIGVDLDGVLVDTVLNIGRLIKNNFGIGRN